jgi:hypothetical protein
MRDLKSLIEPVQSLAPAARNASANGSVANLQGYNSAVAVVEFGTITDGTHTPKLQESTDNFSSDANDVVAADLNGSFVAGTSGGGNGSNTVQRVGYIGAKQYIRVVMTVAGATTGAVAAASIIAGHPAQAPTA